MKIVHTYLPITIDKIDKKTIYQMTLSVLLAKKHYDKVVLYTNVETADIVKKIGLPYDEINVDLLEGIKIKTFSIPKIMVYSVQTEPFIHIDLDAFLFYKIEFNDLKRIYSAYNEGTLISGMKDDEIGFYDTYFRNSFLLRDKISDEFKKQIRFDNIPNMCVFGGYDYDVISKASSYCLEIYNKNSDFFDENYYNACIIEQLFIPTAIRLLKNDIKFEYIFGKGNPSQFKFLNKSLMEYPFEVVSKRQKRLTGEKYESIVFENEIDMNSKISYKFNGFLHLCGYKNFDEILFLIRSKLLFEIKGNINYPKKIDEVFDEKFVFEKDMDYYDEMKKLNNKKRNVI